MAYIFINGKNFGLLREAFLKNATCWSLKVYFRAKNKERKVLTLNARLGEPGNLTA